MPPFSSADVGLGCMPTPAWMWQRGGVTERAGGPDPDGRSWLGADDPPAAHGAALGAGGVEGWWAWKHRRRTQRGMEAVAPATLRGTVEVALWLCGLIAINTVGPMIVSLPRPIWWVVAAAVMVVVARWWRRRSKRPPAI